MLTHLLAGWAAIVATLLALDALWLGVIARPWYAQGIGHLMASEPRLGVAALFYALYAGGLLVLAVQPQAAATGAEGWWRVAGTAALLGLFAYGTYDLSNLATLRGWPVWLSAMDIAWGCLLTVAAACAGRAAMQALR